MLVDEMLRSFVKKNYSHYPLKKRPVHVLYEDSSESVKDEIIDVVTDDIPEPENLSTKPEDLSRISEITECSGRSSAGMSTPTSSTSSPSTATSQAKKSFSCKYCEKIYVSLGAFQMHIRTHTLPYMCHFCGKAFSRSWILQDHIRTHTGEKPFSCQHCNRAFANRSNFRAHLQTHSDVKKYSCNSCSKTFSRKPLLTKHQEGGCPGMAVAMGYSC